MIAVGEMGDYMTGCRVYIVQPFGIDMVKILPVYIVLNFVHAD